MGWLKNNEEERQAYRIPWFTLSGLFVIPFIYFAFGPASEGLRYDRALIAEGQYWRLVTGHLVHVDILHLSWNMLAFGLIGLFMEWPGRLRWQGLVPAGLVLMFAVDLYLWIGRPDILHYGGISALLNGFLLVCLLRLIPKLGRRICLLFAAGAFAKILSEIWLGSPIVAETAWPSMPDAHLVGFLAGGLVALATRKLSFTQREFQILPRVRTDKDAV